MVTWTPQRRHMSGHLWDHQEYRDTYTHNVKVEYSNGWSLVDSSIVTPQFPLLQSVVQTYGECHMFQGSRLSSLLCSFHASEVAQVQCQSCCCAAHIIVCLQQYPGVGAHELKVVLVLLLQPPVKTPCYQAITSEWSKDEQQESRDLNFEMFGKHITTMNHVMGHQPPRLWHCCCGLILTSPALLWCPATSFLFGINTIPACS